MGVTALGSRQIIDGAITDAKVAAGAAIVSSKLADGANFIKKDGSVAFSGNISHGGNLINSVGTPSLGTDAANKNYVDTQIANLNSLFKAKPTARAASTANVVVSNPGTAVFDGVTLAANDRLLLKNQAAPAENGIYTFVASGSALVRATDMDAWNEVNGAFVSIDEGTVNADTIWLCTANAGGTIGTTAITWQQIPSSTGLANTNFVDKEIPSGAINGSNTTFTLANTPVAGSEHVYINGVLQESGAGNDYTISTATITTLAVLLAGEKIRVSYRK